MLPHLKLYCVEKPFRHALFVPLAQAHAGCPASPKPLHLWVQSTLMPCLASNLTSLDDHLIFSSLLSVISRLAYPQLETRLNKFYLEKGHQEGVKQKRSFVQHFPSA